MDNNSSFLIGIVGGLVGSIVITSGIEYFGNIKTVTIPTSNHIAKNNIVLENLEYRLEDLDTDGKDETIVTIKDIDYIWKFNEKGKPELLEYKIEPKKIIYKK